MRAGAALDPDLAAARREGLRRAHAGAHAGCGTGDASIVLAKAGWDVTGADFVDAALDRARANAKAADAKIRFVRADATRLRDFDVGKDFDLVVDLGCFHGLEGAQRDGYVREIDAIASATTTFLLLGFTPANHRPIGFDRAKR